MANLASLNINDEAHAPTPTHASAPTPTHASARTFAHTRREDAMAGAGREMRARTKSVTDYPTNVSTVPH